MFVTLGVSYVGQIWFYRIAVWVLPLVVLVATKRTCDALRAAERVGADREVAEREAKGDALTP